MSTNTKAQPESREISLTRVEPDRFEAWLVGRTPLIHNRLAEKARQELLMPRGKLSSAEKAGRLKHEPLTEFRSSLHRRADAIFFPGAAIKGAMATAALDTEGTRRTEVGRLVWIERPDPVIYGIPKLMMAVVRSADINKTPDIRTRAVFEEWCLKVVVSYARPKMTLRNTLTLLHNAGYTVGVGDYRPEKGKGDYGQYRVTTDETEAEIQRLTSKCGWEAQQAAIASPEFYDVESQELFDWFALESVRREKNSEEKAAAAERKSATKRKTNAQEQATV